MRGGGLSKWVFHLKFCLQISPLASLGRNDRNQINPNDKVRSIRTTIVSSRATILLCHLERPQGVERSLFLSTKTAYFMDRKTDN